MAEIHQPTPTNTGAWVCERCNAEYSSPMAAAYCCDSTYDIGQDCD